MATTKRRKATKKLQKATTSLVEVRRAMADGKDIVLVSGTMKRPEVRVRHDGLNRLLEIDRFGFLAYRPNAHSVRYHAFVDGEYIGVDRSKLSAAMVEALAFAAISHIDPEGVVHRASAVCDVLRIVNV